MDPRDALTHAHRALYTEVDAYYGKLAGIFGRTSAVANLFTVNLIRPKTVASIHRSKQLTTHGDDRRAVWRIL